MRKVTTWATILVSALLFGGCESTIFDIGDSFYEVPARVGFSNGGLDSASVRISNKDEGPVVPPGGSAAFKVKVPVAQSAGSDNSIYDLIVSLQVEVYDLGTGKISRPITCTFGAKVVTSIYYEVRGVPPHQYASVECRHS